MKMIDFILKILAICFFCFATNAKAQSIKVISKGIESDSSYYHIEKINNNEYWAGGEYGILTKIDSLGNTSSIPYDNDGKSILKIQKVNNYIFIATADAVIYRYDINKQLFIKKEFKGFKNKCFYDLIPLKNGQLLICGGTKGISNGEKKMPHGFIGVLNQDLEDMKIVWHCYRKFVWSVLQQENEEILAATFNGFNTKILRSNKSIHFKKIAKVKGLVHEIALLNNSIWHAGSKNIHYTKDGIIGENYTKNIKLKGIGCLWSMDNLYNRMVGVSNSGKIVLLNNKTSTTKIIDTPTNYSLYDIANISGCKLLMVGHAKTIFLVEINREDVD